ncbi:DUF3572 family protein [Pseudorhodoplanes sp.]|uniref:DUF3572 family protein n=1 Tax=Pseudorhodoplanes sp. TaxID=1934341 RepID=UPI00391D233A
MRTAAREPGFLAGVLDHLSERESVLLAFAQEAGLRPEQILQARDTLAGLPVERDIP